MKKIQILQTIEIAIAAVLACLIMAEVSYAGSVKPKIRIVNVKDNKKVMYVEKSFKLSLKINNRKASAKKFIFSSSNKNVATVSKKGIITAKKKGKAILTVKLKANRKAYTKIKVLVGTRVKTIKLTGRNTMVVGTSCSINAQVLPANATDKTLVWESSNSKIATVTSSGRVTALQEGTVQITAGSRDGSRVKSVITIRIIKLDSGDARFIAHRGLSRQAPENTLAAFNLAAGYPFWGIECDVRETAPEDPEDPESSRFVIMHDAGLKRMCGVDALVSDLKPSEISQYTITSGNNVSKYNGERIPFLEDYLTVFNNNTMVPVIEIKEKEMSYSSAVRFVDLLREYGVIDRANIISFYSDALDAVKQAYEQVSTTVPNLTYLISADLSIDGLSSYNEAIDRAAERGYSGLVLSKNIMNKQISDTVHARGLRTGVFTIDDKNNAYDFITGYSLDYLTTNDLIFG